MRRVIIESPYRGTTPEEAERNAEYLRACLRDSLLRGEAPFASRLVGAKPEPFALWLFRVLGLTPADELVDLFPGTGAIGRAWERFREDPTTGLERASGPRRARKCACGRETSEPACPHCGADTTRPGAAPVATPEPPSGGDRSRG